MLMPDVNVLVGAYRTDSARHLELREWLERTMRGGESVGLSDAVLSGFVRVVTHPKVFAKPTPIAVALQQASSLRAAKRATRVVAGAHHWGIFERLCTDSDARGNLVADAAHAALAIEAGAVWVTLDRDFARFDGLIWRSPV